MNAVQINLPLVQYQIATEIISQRTKDGYVNATAMCKAAGKTWADYSRLAATQSYLSALSTAIKMPISELVQPIKGGIPTLQGTWVHPKIAINLAQWLSPEFAVKVTQWVFDWMSGKAVDNNLPYHLRRYIENMPKVPKGYFSILNEMTIGLIGPLESLGYIIPDSMLPDISEGKMFCGWLRQNGYNPDTMPYYPHTYEDGRTVKARAYPIDLLPAFRKHFIEVWMSRQALQYFGRRDSTALPYVEKLLALPNYSDAVAIVEKS